MIRWLHISDLHIKDKADWKAYRKEIIQKCRGRGQIDIVIVTGDFHDFLAGADFHLAQDFLVELMEGLQLDITKDLFVIPGNHDGVTAVNKKNIYVDAIKGNPLSPDEECLKQLESAFEDYEEFVKQLIPDYPVEHPAQSHVRSWNDKINFIHCNTAIASDSRGDKQNQMLNMESLWNVNVENEKVNIMLAHNSFSDLDTEIQSRLKDFMRVNEVVAYFCGDRHKQDFYYIEIDDKKNKRVPCVVSFKSAPEAQDDYSNFGIIIGEWNGENAGLQGWTWKSGTGFTLDGKISEIEIDMHRSDEDAEEAHEKLWEQSTDIKVCEHEQDKWSVENRKLMRAFAQKYHNLTPHMILKYNIDYEKSGWAIKNHYTEQELLDYIKRAEKDAMLEELNRYIDKLILGE